MSIQSRFWGRVMKLSEFNVIETLSYINRFSNLRNNREQTVADHAYRVAMLCTVLCDEINDRVPSSSAKTKSKKQLRKLDYSLLMRFALFHDVEEAIVGDIPYPYKSSVHYQAQNESEFVSAQLKNDNILSRYNRYIIAKFQPKERLEFEVMKFCDMLDLVFYSFAEIKSGNRHFLQVINT